MPDAAPAGAQASGTAPELRRCIRDLVALSTLSAIWTHAEPAEIAEGLGDALLAILACEFIHIRLRGASPPATIVDHACARGLRREQALATLRPLVQPYLDADVGSTDVPELQLPGGRCLRISVHRFGHGAFSGILVAGSARADFPSELERLILGVGVNQATTTLQRHDAESHRRDTERRFQQFMENVPGLAWIKDERGRFVYVNEASAVAFGKGREELIGLTDAEVLSPTTAASCIESDSRVARTGAPLQVLEAFQAAGGSTRHMLVTKFPIPADTGPALLGGIAVDATDRIAAEEALHESDRRKDEFLAMLAHELRNPLAPVRNAATILKLKSGHVPEIRWAADMIERQTAHMTRLVDDLLDVSRITRGAITLRKERLVLQEVARAAVESVRPLLEAAHHELEVALPATPIFVDGDATRLAQVLANLLNNAAKYTPRGGRIRLEASPRGGLAEIRVADNGIGIPPEMLGPVFDLFVQVDNSIERAQSGLGIGLTMVKRLVELHGGSVVAESAGAGAGSTFTVRVPLASPVATERAEPTAQVWPANGVRRRVLVVDDNRDAAASLGALLEHSGCEVRLAFEGVEAIGAFSLFLPDIVILDIGLPKMNGYEVVRHLRTQHANRKLTCIALTGFGKEEDRAAALAAGFDHHLTKPVAYDTLRELMAQLEWRRRHERGLAQNGA